MADRISFGLEDANGAPLVGLLPAPSSDWFVQYRTAAGVSRTPPLISEIGGGQYGFSPTDADEAAGVAFLLDAGASAFPRRFSGAIHTPTQPFIAFHLESEDGSLWAGASPSVGIWRDFSGNARAAPSIITPGATTYLFAAVPSTADLELDVAFRIDAPAGAFPEYFTGSLEAQPWVAPSPGPLKNPAADVAGFLNGKVAGAATLTFGTNLFVGKLPNQDRAPVHPCVAVRNTGGPQPQPYIGGHRESFLRPTVQVMVRGPAGDDQAGELVAREILAWLHLQVTAGYTSWNAREAQPTFLGTDRDQHGQWSMNFECTYRAALD